MIGKIVNISQDFLNGGISLTLSMSQCSVQELQALSAFDALTVDMKKYRKPRSKDANAYFHVLVGKIADSMMPPLSKTFVKNVLIARYGQPDTIDNEQVHIKTEIPPEKIMEQESIHCVHCGTKEEDGKMLYFYKIYRGSHTYDTKEMSVLISGTVEEAKALGIETMTPAELERLVSAWKA